MKTKIYIKDGYQYSVTYQTWNEILLEGWLGSCGFILAGIIGLFVTPYMAFFSKNEIGNARHWGRKKIDKA